MNCHSLLLPEALSRQSSEQVAKTLPLMGIKADSACHFKRADVHSALVSDDVKKGKLRYPSNLTGFLLSRLSGVIGHYFCHLTRRRFAILRAESPSKETLLIGYCFAKLDPELLSATSFKVLQ